MRWKYKVIVLSTGAKAIANRLSSLGSEGWELVAVQETEKGHVAYLKMPVEEDIRIIRL